LWFLSPHPQPGLAPAVVVVLLVVTMLVVPLDDVWHGLGALGFPGGPECWWFGSPQPQPGFVLPLLPGPPFASALVPMPPTAKNPPIIASATAATTQSWIRVRSLACIIYSPFFAVHSMTNGATESCAEKEVFSLPQRRTPFRHAGLRRVVQSLTHFFAIQRPKSRRPSNRR
jgi:hypothetical protein